MENNSISGTEEINDVSHLELYSAELRDNASRVNRATLLRKEKAEKIIEQVSQAVIFSTRIHDDILQVGAANVIWRNKHNTILSMCEVLGSNIDQQRECLKIIQKEGVLDPADLTRIDEYLTSIENSLKDALSCLKNILEMKNKILLLDKILELKKRYQLSSLKTLQKLARAIFADSENAEKGSLINYSRWTEFADSIDKIGVALEEKNIELLETFYGTIKKARVQTIDVINNSSSQYEFTEQVNCFVDKFYNESVSIKEVIDKKHVLFEQNLQNSTVLTVIISFEFKKYLELEKILNSISLSGDTQGVYADFMILNEIASDDVKYLTELNLDMTEISHITNENETKIVEITEDEIILFNTIKKLVAQMMEHTEIPISGAQSNLERTTKTMYLYNKLLKENNIELTRGKQNMSEGNKVKKIMVIDDGAAIRQVVSHVLKSEGYEIIEGVDGEEALSKLDGTIKIDLFICDVNMPNVDGIEFLEKIKTDEKYRSYKFTPIVMLTTEAGESMKEKGKMLGAHAWIVKPFQPDQLLAKIKPLLG
jgi:two-component system chemotaxis response regulator CheY